MQCNNCGEFKPINNEFFSTRAAHWTGFNPRCKVCVNEIQRDQRASNPEQYEIEKTIARERRRAIYAADPEAGRELARLWREANPEKQAAIQDQSQRKRVRSFERYRLTQEDYDRMLDEQGGVCAVVGCERTNGKKRLHVDHDHSCCPGEKSCGQCVRGLLCQNCNRAAGQLRDDPVLAIALADYLMAGGFKYDDCVRVCSI